MAKVSQGHIELADFADGATPALLMDAINSSEHPISVDEDGEGLVVYRHFE